MNKVLAYLDENSSNSNLSIEEFTSEVNLSASQRDRKLKRLTGQTPNELVREIR